MDRNQAKELLPIIQAYAEGKSIEFSSITDVSKAWREVTDFPLGMIGRFKFRIKPEQKYRPFENGKECLKEMKKHEPFGWVKSEVFDYAGAISSVSNELGNLCVCNSYVTFKEGFNNYTFFDGTPFGVNEEE